MMHRKMLLIISSFAAIGLGSFAMYSQLNSKTKPLARTGNVEIIKVTAKKYEFSPARIELKKGQTTILELSSLDRLHGFYVPDLEIIADVMPGKPVQVSITPEETGTFRFLCNSFCGSGHEEMHGEIIVVE
jgi:cytochrome c oxidase subunit II